MIDIHEQKEFSFQTEEKDIVITTNTTHSLVKELEVILGEQLNNLLTETFTTVYSLGKLKAKRVHIVNFDKLKKDCKRREIFKKIAAIKDDFVVLVDTFENNLYLQMMTELSETIMVNNHKLTTFKSKNENKDKNVYYYGETAIYEAVKKGYVLGEAINMCKDLVNTPYNYLNATGLADFAKSLEKLDGVTVKIFNKKEIEDMNMGAFLGVNKGSKDEPKLIQIKYQGLEKWENPTALVGKGVMYDTGGYSLKTPTGMPGMKVDMAGAAAVISSIHSIAKLKLKANVMSIVAATDNRIGENAIVPDDILTAASGTTIEIISTDAEGRLTLADAVWFAQKEGAKKVIDVATLTGAMVAALGSEFTGAFTNNDTFLNEFKEATKVTKERIWEMPISCGYRKELKSEVADITNKGGRLAGASIAAAFIEKFIEKDTEWIHLDIAGTASKKTTGATGVMVKTFTELFYN